jgi:hypothetical protein
MAKKRRKKITHRRRRRGMSEGVATRVKRTRSRRRTHKKGFLSELSSGENIQAYLKDGVSAGIGGFLAGEMEPMVANYTPFQQALVFLGVSYLASSAGYKNISMGVAGAYGLKMSRQRRGLSDDMEDNTFINDEDLEDEADAMDEMGNPMYLADDGEYYYAHELQDDDMEDDDMEDNYRMSNSYNMSDDEDMSANLLAANLLADGLYPDYINTSNY